VKPSTRRSTRETTAITVKTEWLGVKQMLGTGAAWFYCGRSGYEYIDLGRLWQIALLAGLFLWLALMVRAIVPALRHPLLVMFLIWSAAAGGGAGQLRHWLAHWGIDGASTAARWQAGIGNWSIVAIEVLL
jgi:hypothetical protein